MVDRVRRLLAAAAVVSGAVPALAAAADVRLRAYLVTGKAEGWTKDSCAAGRGIGMLPDAAWTPSEIAKHFGGTAARSLVPGAEGAKSFDGAVLAGEHVVYLGARTADEASGAVSVAVKLQETRSRTRIAEDGLRLDAGQEAWLAHPFREGSDECLVVHLGTRGREFDDSAAPLDLGSAHPEVTKPKLVHRVEPEVPEVSRRKGTKGNVELAAVIDEDGRVTAARIVSSNDFAFAIASLDAVMRWTYEPARRDGRPVAVRFVVKTSFRTG